MGREQVRRIPIVDERGALVGIVAQADLVRMAGNDKTGREDGRADLAARRQAHAVPDRPSGAALRERRASAARGRRRRCSFEAMTTPPASPLAPTPDGTSTSRCPACGAPATGPLLLELRRRARRRRLRQCSASLTPGARFCHRCGTPAGAPSRRRVARIRQRASVGRRGARARLAHRARRRPALRRARQSAAADDRGARRRQHAGRHADRPRPRGRCAGRRRAARARHQPAVARSSAPTGCTTAS